MTKQFFLQTIIAIIVLWMVAANYGFAQDSFSDYPEVTRIEFPPTGSWNTVSTIRVPLKLLDGFNSFNFFNKNNPAPDFDKIIIIPDSGLLYQSEAENNVIVGNSIIVQRSSMSGGEGVGHIGRGVENYLVYNIDVKSGFAGSYEMAIDYTNGDSTSRISYMVTNKPPICPRWALEHWVWEDNDNTQDAVTGLVEEYLANDIPVGAVIIDSPWETCYNNFKWLNVNYPNPQQMIDRFHSDGIKVIMWITGFVNNDTGEDIPLKKCEDYDAVEPLSVNEGEDFNWWKGQGRHIDFTSINAKQWWHEQMDQVLIDMDIDGWKTDNGASHVSDPVHTSIDHNLPRQIFKQYYYADIYDYSVSVNPQAISMARAFSGHQDGIGASISKNPIAWQGDFSGDFPGLIDQMEDIYESALLGYGILTVEVGGFYDAPPTKESLIRYVQFGALCSGMENGGANGGIDSQDHLPWKWDEETIDIYRYFATLHSELVPYIFSYSVESYLTGISTLRNVDKGRRHHKLGEEIFISIITDEDVTSKTVELPEGARWIDYWQEDSVYDGGTSIDYTMESLKEFPIFLKVGAIIPMNVKNDETGHGNNFSEGKITLNIYPGGHSNFLYHHPTGDGIDYDNIQIDVDEEMGTITIDGERSNEYILKVKSFEKPCDECVHGADDWYYDDTKEDEYDREKIINIVKTGTDFTITIAGLRGYVIDNSDNCPNDINKKQPGICGCGIADTDTDNDGTMDCNDSCPSDISKIYPGICGCGIADSDTDNDGTVDCNDYCDNDPKKINPGICGCGTPDNDYDTDGTMDCNDGCPNDPLKIDTGVCGCGTPDTDFDIDGTPNCIDECPNDQNKIEIGECGCGLPDNDTDTDNDGTLDCNDNCPTDPNKIVQGLCGCGVADTDTDTDRTPDCNDNCPNDPDKTNPGVCGCDTPDVDTDNDGVFDCNDNCDSSLDTDKDGWGDCDENCPNDPNKTEPGACGCGVPDTDSDVDGTLDCNDLCPNDQGKTQPGSCGCGVTDIDNDGDGTMDCNDGCPADISKTDPGFCGCGNPETDTDADGTPDCIDTQPIVGIISPNSDQTIPVGDSINFQCTVSNGNTPFTYSWNFDGGAETSTLRDPGEVIFKEVGTYNVILVITDNDGDISNDYVSVIVTEQSGGDNGGGGGCFITTMNK